MRPPGQSRRDEVRLVLRESHRRRADQPIRVPSPDGAFPDSVLVVPSPVVPDANVLRNDVRYACRRSRRTTLVSAANAGLLRLFCARHVLDEVTEHAGDWTEGPSVSRAEFLHRWTTEYVPLIRVVPIDGDAAQLLTPKEMARLRDLEGVDPDDLPSATLALLLGAFYLSEDRPALRAVYGRDIDPEEGRAWLPALQAAGDAGLLLGASKAALNVAALLADGLVAGVRRAPRIVGAAGLVVLVVAAAALARGHSTGASTRFRSVASDVGTALGEVLGEYQAASARFARIEPAIPDWVDLALTHGGGAALVRACLHALARSPANDRSAAELADVLRGLPIARGERKVRVALRARSCFFQVWQGRWQIGEPAGRREG